MPRFSHKNVNSARDSVHHYMPSGQHIAWNTVRAQLTVVD